MEETKLIPFIWLDVQPLINGCLWVAYYNDVTDNIEYKTI